MQRAPHPLAAFGNRLIGQPDDAKRRQPRRRLHLNIDV